LQLDAVTSDKSLVRTSIRTQAGALAADILGLCPLYRESYIEAVNAASKQTALVNNLFARLDQEELLKKMEQALSVDFVSITNAPFAKLTAATKAFFFFIRAYQDGLYRMAFEVVTACNTGRHAAMSKAFLFDERTGTGTLTSNPVAECLKRAFPDYRDWFVDFRNKRNLIKNGIGTGYSGPDDNLGVVLAMPDGKGGAIVDCSLGITISHWAQALTMSSKLANVISCEANNKFGST
jgi:hypothetical protein